MFDSLKSGALTFLAGLAVLLGVLLFSSWGRQELAESRLATEKSEHERTRDAIAAQKREAANELRSANASVLAQQNRLDAAQLARAQSDAANGNVVAGLRLDLLRMRESRRLQLAAEAARRGDGGAAEQGGGRPDAPGGGGNATHASRLLPTEATGTPEDDADDDAYDADRINVAYASCRADTLNIRAALAP